MRHVFAAAAAASVFLLPASALAHETQIFRIGGEEFRIVVGSQNEPAYVDDKSGVELMISHPKADGTEGEPVTGLETTLKVEVSAGARKKVFDLKPAYGEPGTYGAVFFPTVETTYAYRLFGTINATNVDLTFTCNPAGHPATAEDKTETTISEGVVRTLKRGAFGCPLGKVAAGFPEPSATMHELGAKGPDWGMVGTALGAVALLGMLSMRRRHRI